MNKEYTIYFSLNSTETILASSQEEAKSKAEQLIKRNYHSTLLNTHEKDFFIEIYDVELD
jgi:hypothetical protein